MNVTEYDFTLLRNRMREITDELYKMRRDLDAVQRLAERTERTCQALSSQSQESSTPTLPASS